MDSFDQFEFKPLTEGLGFHNNADIPTESFKEAAKDTNTEVLKETKFEPKKEVKVEVKKELFVPSLPNSYDFTEKTPAPQAPVTSKNKLQEVSPDLEVSKKLAPELTQSNVSMPQFYQPIGRPDYNQNQKKSAPVNKPLQNQTSNLTIPNTANLPLSVPVPGAPASLSALRAEAQAKTQAITGKPQQLESEKLIYKEIATSIPAAILDAIFAFGMSMIMLVIILVITKADLLALLNNAGDDYTIQLQLVGLYAMVMNMYFLMSRSSWFGQSLGEWTYEVQLGTNEQKSKWVYPLQVIWRSLLFTLTGFILIPLLSLLSKKDLASILTGAKLYQIERKH